jgi:DNA-directed RNA polymerase subunit RPC12/RpoP
MTPDQLIVNTCPECGAKALYKTRKTINSGGYFNPLPGLGGFLQFAYFHEVVCSECGLVRFFASRDARGKLAGSAKWRRID